METKHSQNTHLQTQQLILKSVPLLIFLFVIIAMNERACILLIVFTDFAHIRPIIVTCNAKFKNILYTPFVDKIIEDIKNL